MDRISPASSYSQKIGELVTKLSLGVYECEYTQQFAQQ